MPTGLLYLLLLMLVVPCRAQLNRGDTTTKRIALVFTGDGYADGGEFILTTLKKHDIRASFFLTGNFYRNENFKSLIRKLKDNQHYLGSHSDRHLLYCDWVKRDSLLVTKQQFTDDLRDSYKELFRFGVSKKDAHYFLPPYEWYNDSIVKWCAEEGLQLVNFTPGTKSTADYTTPDMGERYISSDNIYRSIMHYEATAASGLNGFILLVHIGTDPLRVDKFYRKLPAMLQQLQSKGYHFVRIDELFSP